MSEPSAPAAAAAPAGSSVAPVAPVASPAAAPAGAPVASPAAPPAGTPSAAPAAPRRRATSAPLRRHARAFVLHTVPHRETSLVVELWTREYGRVGVVARGARRPRSALRATLLSFQPLDCGFVGNDELRTLTQAEWVGGCGMPAGRALLHGFYLNELLLRTMQRDDPHPRVWDAYAQAIAALAEQGPSEAALRRFEWLLLREAGWAPDLERDRDGVPIDPDLRYHLNDGQWVAVRGPAPAAAGDAFAGHLLRDIAVGRYDAPTVLRSAKRLTRTLLAEPLHGVPLRTRQMLLELQRMNHDRTQNDE